MSSSTARLGHVPGAKVIAYYADADGQYSANKIGYDVGLFDQSLRDIAFGEIRKDQDENRDQVEPETIEMSKLTVNDSEAAPATSEEPISIPKESVKFICEHLEVNAKLAEKALKHVKGSLEDALLHLIHERDLN